MECKRRTHRIARKTAYKKIQKGDVTMAHRSGAGRGDQKRFTQTAKRVKNINVRPKVSRGGIRL